ncbi:SPOR domain-containing protein [cf. Phormidesmis sp. LEGE 11477]|uniref:SPOR domain-containing protein n=1 Tax=cf. Phormidesmis sp. LEGE 11477 TaxID=1828680 RepID=UPI0019DEDDF0|nr:hypothetical protein [cf. Phormidesmis sp. LEGE 11477]MBE9064898.1 hypothetical protein [cf. Phormidesmis sp. LEGE 11477]
MVWNLLCKWSGICAIAWVVLSLPAQAACRLFSEPQRFNTQVVGDVIVIGYQPNRPYRVVVQDGSAATLARLRGCVLDAYLTRSPAGSYIHIASFSQRQDAETIRRILRRDGYPVRVIYRR